MTQLDRRGELADFLRLKRNSTTPAMLGLPEVGQRRTLGLRRSEVAELADISENLYAWLEQGRKIAVSLRTIDAIAKALRCDTAERDHMRALASAVAVERNEQLQEPLRRFVGSLPTHPVIVLNHRWDIVLCNMAAKTILFSLIEDPLRENLLKLTFGPRARALNVEWEVVARSVIELFRFDLAFYNDEATAVAVADELRSSDEDFARFWKEHRVRRAPLGLRQFRHPCGGVFSFDPLFLAVPDSPGLRALVFTPADEETARQVGELVVESFN